MAHLVGTPSPEGLRFGPTASDKMYLCYKEHRGAGNAYHKSIWAITAVEEYSLFCTADDNDWKDDQNCYWAVKNGEILGTCEERVAKFWDRTPWHGFPVLTRDVKLPITLIKLWQETKQISKTDARRMKDGRF